MALSEAAIRGVRPDPTTRLLDIEAVSERTTIPVGTLRYWRHLGTTGPRSAKIGRRVMYRESDVDEWLDEQFASTDQESSEAEPASSATA